MRVFDKGGRSNPILNVFTIYNRYDISMPYILYKGYTYGSTQADKKFLSLCVCLLLQTPVVVCRSEDMYLYKRNKLIMFVSLLLPSRLSNQPETFARLLSMASRVTWVGSRGHPDPEGTPDPPRCKGRP